MDFNCFGVSGPRGMGFLILWKCSLRRSIRAPASRSAATTDAPSSDSSRKKVSGSGGLEVELAADRVPDRFLACTVFLRQLANGIPGFELFGEHRRRDARSGDHRPAERHTRIDHHATRLFAQGLRAHERI